MRLEFHPSTVGDVNEAASHYGRARAGLDAEFRTEIDAVIERIARNSDLIGRSSMPITKQDVAKQFAAYFHHRIELLQLVDWAENAMMDGEFDDQDAATISAVVARLGVADVRAFGLAWTDCEDLLAKLGFSARVEIVAT